MKKKQYNISRVHKKDKGTGCSFGWGPGGKAIIFTLVYKIKRLFRYVKQ